MLEGISKFYRDTIAREVIETSSVGTTQSTHIIYPISRVDFFTGSGIAALYLIEKIAVSAFFLVANIFTCFHSQDLRNSLLENVQVIPTYLGAIPFGYIGAIIPQTINNNFLQIPTDGLITVSTRRL